MVLYLPKKRSASQPPSKREKVNADDEGVENVLGPARRDLASGRYSSSDETRKTVRMFRIP